MRIYCRSIPVVGMTLKRELATLELHHGPGFGDHGSRVALLSVATARYLGMRDVERNRLWMAALVHDVGKTDVDPSILEKSGALTTDESELVRRHPETGHDQIVDVVRRSVAEAVLCHHERWDGGGFPHGLKRKEIPLFARIIFVADAFDVMTTGRSYRPSQGVVEAGEELTRLAGRQFDPHVVDAFASIDRSVLAPGATGTAGPPVH